MKIADPETLKKLPSMSSSDVDKLDFGVVKVDDSGVIKLYNAYLSELGKVEPSKAMGKHFFTEIAPCTNNRLFYGRFQDGVAKESLDLTIPYTFTYKIDPTNVNIQMYRDNSTKTNWVLIKRR